MDKAFGGVDDPSLRNRYPPGAYPPPPYSYPPGVYPPPPSSYPSHLQAGVASAPPAYSPPSSPTPMYHQAPSPSADYPGNTTVPMRDSKGYDCINWSSDRHVPPTAVRDGVDRDGCTIYVGRAYHEGHWIPAKVIPDTPIAYVPYAGSEHSTNSLQVALSTNKTLMDEEWFHGVLPQEEAVRLLTEVGDFLVRETTRNDECQTVLSVCWDGHKHFMVRTTAKGHFRFESAAFPSIRELILYQFNSGLPVTNGSGAILYKPIPRERWKLNNDDVLLLDKIGEGHFGDVYKARLKSTGHNVAVKTSGVTLPEEHKKKFLQEARILKQYDHPNIVKLIGICVQELPIMIVMELEQGGSLLTYLRKHSSLLIEAVLMLMCSDAAAGMRYLESKNCIHRDLAAHNCLVGNLNRVKISDFGMSRKEYIVSNGTKQTPVKWTAPEAYNYGKYTSLSDVWSYGILCWEIFSRGSTPYSDLSAFKARPMIDRGYRMPAPDNTPDEMYSLMLRCWKYHPEARPNFEQIFTVVDTLNEVYKAASLKRLIHQFGIDMLLKPK